jgi:hypothetical protein
MRIDLENISHRDLVDLLCVATEGSDWLAITTLESERFMDDEVEQSVRDVWCREDRWANRLLKGGHIVCLDFYDDSSDEYDMYAIPARYELTLDDVRKGLIKARDGEAIRDWADFCEWRDDYFTCNNLVQVCMFGEVVYG